MGLVGRYIDSLTDEQRDRIVEAEMFSPELRHWWSRRDGCGCIVGTAEAMWNHTMLDENFADYPVDEHSENAGIRVHHLAVRFGHDRVVRACKLRAGAKVLTTPDRIVVYRDP